MTNVTIKDLSAELDAEAMAEVQGGLGNQANGTSQSNVQGMAAVANVGNGSLFVGPATIQSDNTFTQDASNTNTSANVDLAAIGIIAPLVPRLPD